MKKFLLLLSLLSCSIIFGYPYKIERLVDGNSTITLLYDVHGDTPGALQQRESFLNFIKKNNGFVIVEDSLYRASNLVKNNLLTYDAAQFVVAENYLPQLKKSMRTLKGFGSHCFYVDIPYQNIEFRQAKLASKCGYPISSSMIFKLSEKIADEIIAYNDNAILNAYYVRVYNHYQKVKKDWAPVFEFMQQFDQPLCNIRAYYNSLYLMLKDVNPSFNTIPINDLLDDLIDFYDANLIDARILHTIFLNRNKFENILIYVGGTHAKHVSYTLGTLGYKSALTCEEKCLKGAGRLQEETGLMSDEVTIETFEQYLATQKMLEKRKKIMLVKQGVTLEDISEEFSNNLKSINKEIKKIGKIPRKKLHEKERLHVSFKKK